MPLVHVGECGLVLPNGFWLRLRFSCSLTMAGPKINAVQQSYIVLDAIASCLEGIRLTSTMPASDSIQPELALNVTLGIELVWLQRCVGLLAQSAAWMHRLISEP